MIAAATLDRFARPSTQAVALWRHWNEPELHWTHGGHVGLVMGRARADRHRRGPRSLRAGSRPVLSGSASGSAGFENRGGS